jgi:hypothetical protein
LAIITMQMTPMTSWPQRINSDARADSAVPATVVIPNSLPTNYFFITSDLSRKAGALLGQITERLY